MHDRATAASQGGGGVKPCVYGYAVANTWSTITSHTSPVQYRFSNPGDRLCPGNRPAESRKTRPTARTMSCPWWRHQPSHAIRKAVAGWQGRGQRQTEGNRYRRHLRQEHRRWHLQLRHDVDGGLRIGAIPDETWLYLYLGRHQHSGLQQRHGQLCRQRDLPVDRVPVLGGGTG